MATRYGKLPFDDSPRTLVFRAIDDLLRSAPILQSVFSKPGAFRSWRGLPEDKADFALQQGVAVRLTPVPHAENWWFPGATKGDLVIMVEMLVSGLVVDDVENLFYAMAKVLRPSDPTTMFAVHDKLKTAGATTGLIEAVNPAHDPNPSAGSDGQFRPVGSFKIEVKTS
jgi:hypothetical protein